MLKKITSIVLVVFIMLGCAACDSEKQAQILPEYPQQEFGIAGFWAPRDISEEGLKLYKEAGFNTLLMVNHEGEKTSEQQFYLGSERTMTALENCKKVGLKAIINYNDWIANWSENNEEYYSSTPFSQFDIYGDYKDIITGVHIVDEPKGEHIPIYSADALIEDFKKVYPNADYLVNLLPLSAGAQYWGFKDYDDMLTQYEENFMKPFEKPYISVDVYPFHVKVPDTHLYLATNYKMIAELAKKYDADKTFILQSSVGDEFEDTLSEADMRWQVNAALAFGADNIQYYCYSLPDGREYKYCMLNADNTPSDLYYYVQKINKEMQSVSSVILAYNWEESIGIGGTVGASYRLGTFIYEDNYSDLRKFKNAKHYVDSTATQDMLISQFTSEKYGEAYMFVNFAKRTDACTAQITFKDCSSVAIYGGVGYDGTPKIVELGENGDLTLELEYGEGVFVTPVV